MMKGDETYSVLIVGTGGQGTVVFSAILANVVMNIGYDVKVAELHGLARRGGAVDSHVRFGQKVASPIIPCQGANLLVAFEELEALRWVGYLKPEGKFVVNKLQIIPVLATSGIVTYPRDPIELIRSHGLKPIVVDATSIAKEMGKVLLLNLVMLGYISNFFEFPIEIWERAVKEKVPKFKEKNWSAFLKGKNMTPISN